MAPSDTDTSVAQPGLTPGMPGIAEDWSSDQRAFKNVPWGKAMMWIFLLSDTFIFSCFLISYMTVRMSTTVPRATSRLGLSNSRHRRTGSGSVATVPVDPGSPSDDGASEVGAGSSRSSRCSVRIQTDRFVP